MTAIIDDNCVKTSWHTLSKLYVLGERVLDTELQHAVIREIVRLSSLKDKTGTRWFPIGPTVTRIYDGTPAGSPARRLMVDTHTSQGNQRWLDCDNHPAFMTDLSKALLA